MPLNLLCLTAQAMLWYITHHRVVSMEEPCPCHEDTYITNIESEVAKVSCLTPFVKVIYVDPQIVVRENFNQVQLTKYITYSSKLLWQKTFVISWILFQNKYFVIKLLWSHDYYSSLPHVTKYLWKNFHDSI